MSLFGCRCCCCRGQRDERCAAEAASTHTHPAVDESASHLESRPTVRPLNVPHADQADRNHRRVHADRATCRWCAFQNVLSQLRVWEHEIGKMITFLGFNKVSVEETHQRGHSIIGSQRDDRIEPNTAK